MADMNDPSNHGRTDSRTQSPGWFAGHALAMVGALLSVQLSHRMD
jgi:hypothetical protein